MNSSPPSAVVVHTLAGRTRLRIEARRGDDDFFASIATGLSAIQGVDQVEARSLTGGVLIQHHLPLAQIAEAAERARLFSVAGFAAARPRLAAAVPDPRTMVAAGLAAFALLQVFRGRILPPAITLALYAATIGRLLHDGAETNDP